MVTTLFTGSWGSLHTGEILCGVLHGVSMVMAGTRLYYVRVRVCATGPQVCFQGGCRYGLLYLLAWY